MAVKTYPVTSFPSRAFPVLMHPPYGDRALAESFWADKEWKKWAVDVIVKIVKNTRYGFTVYVGARTATAAIACAKENLYRPVPSNTQFVARLAGPKELGCDVGRAELHGQPDPELEI